MSEIVLLHTCTCIMLTSSYLCLRICDMNDDIRYVDNPLSTNRPGVGVNIIYMAMEGVLFIVLTLLLEVRLYCMMDHCTNTCTYT